MTSSPIVREYSAAQASPGLFAHLRGLTQYPATIWRYRSLMRNFSRRELLGRFHGSFLGAFWVLLIFGLLFARSSSTASADATDPAYAFYLFSGIIVFTAFGEATARCCSAILSNGNLVKKVMFPCELLPVPTVLVSLVVYGIGAAVFLAIGILLANLQVFMRDTSHLYGIVRTAWFFCSPVFWDIGLIRGRLGDTAASLFKLNPMYGLIQAQRQTLGLGSSVEIVPEPLWQNLGSAAAWAAALLAIGYVSFMACKHKYADLV
jgi:lipopolysaccharide transport system permease protein